ncbi:MAG: hypothetical protein IRZ13_00225 [Acetobacteraceae bacterium]|nr:hypothetical protein [Acetobacteraceae bacterium]
MPAATVNEAYFKDSNTWLEAQGYQWRNASHGRGKTLVTEPDADAPKGFRYARTGGLVIRRRVTLAEDNRMFRFAARRYIGSGAPGLEPLLNSPWWMEEDRMVLLLGRARTAGVPLVEMARRQLALPAAWTDCDVLVSVRIRPGVLIGAFAGPGITATAGDERRIVAPEAPHLFIDQLYIPGLGRLFSLNGAGQSNASAWFDTASARAFDPAARGLNP